MQISGTCINATGDETSIDVKLGRNAEKLLAREFTDIEEKSSESGERQDVKYGNIMEEKNEEKKQDVIERSKTKIRDK